MIDENLCRAELSPADRAAQTARRKAIYIELHPETAHGGDRRSDQVANIAIRSFVAETAETSGKAERTVRLDAERGEKVSEAALNLVRGTALDTGSYLDRLKARICISPKARNCFLSAPRSPCHHAPPSRLDPLCVWRNIDE